MSEGEGRSSSGRRAEDDGDLTDVYFMSEDELLLPDTSFQERVDEGFSEEDFIEDEAIAEAGLRYPIAEPRDATVSPQDDIVDEVVAVLGRVESFHRKPTTPLGSITPQMRPRVHYYNSQRNMLPRHSQKPMVLKQHHSYNLRFSHQPTRMIQYSSPNVSPQVNTFQYNPSKPFSNPSKPYSNPSKPYSNPSKPYSNPSKPYTPLRRYIANHQMYRNLNNWNPQASFPSALSNPRFKKYTDRAGTPEGRSIFLGGDDGSNNLNFNHLMQPRSVESERDAEPPSPPAMVPQHYIFNLTSHLIRSQQIDPRPPPTLYKSREPR